MNIFNRVALQAMKKSRTRTAVTIVGVVLSAAMITAVAAFGTSLLNYLMESSAAKYGGWHVEFVDEDASFADEQAHDEQVAGVAAFENIGYAVLEGGKSPEKPYLFVAGFSEEAFDSLPISLISGRMPENNGEVIVPAHVALKGGVRYFVGDTLTLSVGNRIGDGANLGQHDPYRDGEDLTAEGIKSYRVVGICERPNFEEHSAPGYTLITKAGTLDGADSLSVFVTLRNPCQAQAYASGAAKANDYVLNDYVLRFMGVSENRLFNTLMFAVGGVLVAIIMVGSIFLIYNSFNISMNERMRQFGILSSIGATARQLQNSVLFEGLCIGAIGIPVGIVVGIGSVWLLIPVVAGNFLNILQSTVPLTLSVSVPAIAGAAAISLVTILISAYIPARKAANTPVMECIRQTNEVRLESKAVRTSRVSQRIYGLEGTLALKNFKRNRKRYSSIVLSLVLSVVLFVSGNAFGSTLKRISDEFTVDLEYDIIFAARDMEDGDMIGLYERLKEAEGVYEGSYQAVLNYICTVRSDELSNSYRQYAGYVLPDETVKLPMDMQFIEDSQYLKFINELGLPSEEYAGPDAKILVVAKARPDENGGNSHLLDMFGESSATLSVAPAAGGMPMRGQERSIGVTFVDTYPVSPPPKEDAERISVVFMAVAPYSLKAEFDGPGISSYTGMGFLSENPHRSVSEMERMIQEEGLTEYTLYNVYDMLEQYHSLSFVIDLFTGVFVSMISLIAVANVFNTISTNIRLRRRELAMLRSVGMSDRAFNRMMGFECIFYGMRTLMFGLPLAGVSSWLIFTGLTAAERMDSFDFALPWGSMALCVLGVFLIVFVTMLYAVDKIKKENIIDALRDDMT